MLSEDGEGRTFRFAPLDGEAFQSRVPAERRDRLPDSLVVLTDGKEIRVRSGGIVRILVRLGGYWRIFGWCLALVPRSLRDLGYRAVARIRTRLFARPLDRCPLMPERYRSRWVD